MHGIPSQLVPGHFMQGHTWACRRCSPDCRCACFCLASNHEIFNAAPASQSCRLICLCCWCFSGVTTYMTSAYLLLCCCLTSWRHASSLCRGVRPLQQGLPISQLKRPSCWICMCNPRSAPHLHPCISLHSQPQRRTGTLCSCQIPPSRQPPDILYAPEMHCSHSTITTTCKTSRPQQAAWQGPTHVACVAHPG